MQRTPSVRPLRSRLGRQIYTLAALLACLPLILVGTYSLIEIDAARRAQSERALDQSLRSFGERLHQKLLQSSELADRLINEQLDAADLPSAFLNYAVVTSDGILHSTFAQGIPQFAVTGTLEKPQIAIVESQAGSEIYLAFDSGSQVFIGQYDQFHLWDDRTQYPFATEFCIVSPAVTKPAYCSAEIPAEVFQAVQQSQTTRGTFSWQNDDSWRAAFWELFLPSAFEAQPLRIVGMQPEGVVYGAASAFRQIYVPGLLFTLIVTLIGAGYHARRFLSPLTTLVDLARRYSNREFSGNVTLARNDEFQDLATAMGGMAQTLDQQFRQQEALSRLDNLILCGDSIEDVFRTAVSEAASYLPFEAIELDIEAEPGGQWFRYTQQRGDDGLTKILLHQTESSSTDRAENENYQLAKINVADLPRGVLRGYAEDDQHGESFDNTQLQALADRIAMALEFSEQSAELNRRAWFDDLTGLPNRESCLRRIDRAIQTADFNGHMVALLYIDLDGFKSVNDSLGHEAGDQLIRLAADRITACIGHHGVTARLGGDEFAVILPYSAGRSDDYKVLGKLVLAELQKPFKIGNSEAYLGASIGTARYPEDGDSHGELLRKADAAMYRAKDAGRGRQVDYSRTLGIVIEKRLMLEADLNRALERNEMHLVYQPQYDLRAGTMRSAEALLRWNHSSEGFISPEEFIPIAEETNQILTLGNWVLFNACAQFSEWQERGVGIDRIAVNIAANQLRHDEFLSQVQDCIDRFRLKPGMLELELTERVFAESKEISTAIHALKQMGVIISIDDFGTGYSSLGSLRNLEFDMVKVDRSFIGSLPHDKQSVSIIQAVLAMCRTLGKVVVAEGVETSQQLAYLADAGVEYGQGYYFSKPVSPQELEHIVRSSQESIDNTINAVLNLRSRSAS